MPYRYVPKFDMTAAYDAAIASEAYRRDGHCRVCAVDDRWIAVNELTYKQAGKVRAIYHFPTGMLVAAKPLMRERLKSDAYRRTGTRRI